MVGKIFSVLKSTIGLLLRKLFGCRVNFQPISLISTMATVKTTGKKARIAFGNRCHVRKNTEIASTNGTIKFGDRCFVNRNCIINAHESIIFGEDVTIGPGVYIYDHDHDGMGGYICAPISVGKKTWIGAGAIILKGVTIGDNCVIAAGTTVTKNVPDNTLLYNHLSPIYKEI